MESQPILYGKDVNTGEIKQLTSIGNLLMLSNKLDDLSDLTISGNPSIGQTLSYNGTKWVNVTKDYLTLSLFGTSNSNLYDYSTSLKNILIRSTSDYWASSVSQVMSSVLYYDIISGTIRGLSLTKTYSIEVNVNLNSYDISEPTRWICRLQRLNNDTFPDGTLMYVQSSQQVDYSAVTLSMVGVFTNIDGFRLLTAALNLATNFGVGVAGKALDTNITIKVLEL